MLGATLGGESWQDAASKGTDVIHAVQKAGTYQPRSAQGQLIGELMGGATDVAKEATGVVGKDIGKGIGEVAGYALGGKEGAAQGMEKGGDIGQSVGEIAPETAMTLAGRIDPIVYLIEPMRQRRNLHLDQTDSLLDKNLLDLPHPIRVDLFPFRGSKLIPDTI